MEYNMNNKLLKYDNQNLNNKISQWPMSPRVNSNKIIIIICIYDKLGKYYFL